MYSIINGERIPGDSVQFKPEFWLAGSQQAAAALEVAGRARSLSRLDRSNYLWKFALLLKTDAVRLIPQLTEDTGRHPKLLEWELESIAQEAERCSSLLEDVSFFQRGAYQYRPFGTAVVIEPSNYLTNGWWFALNALAAGNAVILKPSECTPLGSVLLAQLALKAGFPPEALQVVQADPAARSQLCEGADVIAMTASKGACGDVKRLVSDIGTPIICEPNGISFAVVGNRADLQKASRGIRAAGKLNSGRVCFRPQVVFAHKTIFTVLAAVLEKLAADATFTCISDDEDRRVQDLFRRWFAHAVFADATVIGGKVVKPPRTRSSVLLRLPIWDNLFAEEAFCDATVISPFESFEDVLPIVNQRQTLAVSLWGDAEMLKGPLTKPSQVWVNSHLGRFSEVEPWCIGPFVQRGREGILQFTHLQGR